MSKLIIFCLPTQIYYTTVLTFQADHIFGASLRYTYRVLQTILVKLILLCVLAEPAILDSTKTALKFKYEIEIGQHRYNSVYGAGYKLEK